MKHPAAPPQPPIPQYVHFAVEGAPVAQGSMRSPRAGVVLHASDKLKGWREAVGWAARRSFKGEPHAGPVEVHLYFTFPTPKKRRGFSLKTTPPDLDKLMRAVLDACTGILWLDDAQVYRAELSKDWQEDFDPGLSVEVWLRNELRAA